MSETLKQYLWVALGSMIGGVGRFWISGLVTGKMGRVFPWDILLINVTGSLVIGALGAVTAAGGKLGSDLRTIGISFLMIGVCGGYTTFSSFSLGTLRLALEGEWLYAAAYVIGSVVFCLLAVALGWWLGQKIMA
jgi:fluoride exporter